MDLSQAALVLVDVQNDFLHPRGLVHRLGLSTVAAEEVEQILGRTNGLIEQMRAAGRPVIWVNTILRADHLDSALPPKARLRGLTAESGFVVAGTWGARACEGVAPDARDLVIEKHGASAFQFTPLDRLLTNLGVRTCVVVSGGPFDGLPETIRQGGALGYGMVIAADANGHGAGSPEIKRLWNRSLVVNTTDILDALATSETSVPVRPRTAMILVDLQNDFFHADGVQQKQHDPLTEDERGTILSNNRRLLSAMRAAGNPIIYAVTTHRKDDLDTASPPVIGRPNRIPDGEDYLIPGTWGAEIVDGIEASPDDFIIGKKGRSAFGFTPLHRTLRNLGVSDCIVTGGGIHGCVEDTIREGVGLGYSFTVAADAIYEPNSPYLDALFDHADFKSTDDILAGLEGNRRNASRS